MKNTEIIKQTAKNTIKLEANAISKLEEFINDDFAIIINKIFTSKGRIVITGIGKSAIIASKIVSTLNSTGTPAIFMHAADAIHGDLGIVQKEDIVMCISNSGNTPEIKVLVPMLKTLGTCLIGMTGNLNSFLAIQSDFIIKTSVDAEASPGNPAPTTSTTAQLVMGDAMAVSLLQLRGFSQEDFARYHPGGSLGKQLYLKVDDLYMYNEKPQVDINSDIRNVIIEISAKRLGSTAVLEGNKVVGVITDGDLRRMLEKKLNFSTLKAKDIMGKNPKTVSPKTMAVDALQIMRNHNITQLIVENNGEYLGVLHLHDILQEGII
ncbi:MAG: KpsF/GutQ family sugar-phosphate isomerase [Bacteroidales bacterium]